MSKDEKLKVISALVSGSLRVMDLIKRDDAWNNGVLYMALVTINAIVACGEEQNGND